MSSAAKKIRRLRASLERAAHVALDEFADDAEQFAQEVVGFDEYWENDTGSARASITGFDPEVTPHDKNFDDPIWQAAQSGAIESKYSGAPYFNDASNYEPVVNRVQKDEEFEAYLTMFVKYAAEISVGGGERLAIELFRDMLGWSEPRFLREVAAVMRQELARS
ncbi:MAG: hypothetical protein ACE5FA_06135 [Dehalococcoidia bacterium]